jgi:hypothetical protein
VKEHGIFDNYLNEVANVLGGNPDHKKFAQSLSENPLDSLDGEAVVRRLHKSLDCTGWKNTTYGSNWIWRSEVLPNSTRKREVALEREVVTVGTAVQWTYQMSTASGTQASRSNRRTAIDLVRRMRADHYAFVELKVRSNNPLFATFEILSYALAYLHARQHGRQGTGIYNVMSAKALDLLILGPSEWYEYKKRGKQAKWQNYKFDWLVAALGNGLNLLGDGIPHMQLSYKRFSDLDDPKLTAEGIVRDALEW